MGTLRGLAPGQAKAAFDRRTAVAAVALASILVGWGCGDRTGGRSAAGAEGEVLAPLAVDQSAFRADGGSG